MQEIDPGMVADTSDSITLIRRQSRYPIYSTLLDIQRHRTLHKISQKWISTLECLYMKELVRPEKPARRRKRSDRGKAIEFPKRLLGRSYLNPIDRSQRDYIAISYTWDPAQGEDAASGGYLVDPRGQGQRVMSKVRDVVFDRVIEYAGYLNCKRFWIDKECIDQKNSREKEVAIQSMDLVYSLSKHPVALLSISIETNEELDALAHLLRGGFVRENRQKLFLNFHHRQIVKADKILRLLDKITSNFWWTRGWTFQEDYRASTKMVLLISHNPSLERQKMSVKGFAGVRYMFGTLMGELCVNSADFRREASRFCLAYDNKANLGRDRERICREILTRAGKYTVILRHTSKIKDGTIRESMSPAIFADISSRSITRCSDLLAIAANCCNYSERLNTKSLNSQGFSLSVAMLALYLINGEIIVNGNNEKDGDTFADNIVDFLKKQSMTTFLPAADEQLTFIKSCRFSHVRLTKEGVQTEGHLWKLGKKINAKLYYRSNPPRGTKNCLSDCEWHCLNRLATSLASGRLGKRYKRLADDLRNYLEDSQVFKKSTPGFSKRFKDSMAREVIEAMYRPDKTLRLASIVDGLSTNGYSPYRGIFITDTDENDGSGFVFTSLCPAKGLGTLGKHISLKVDLEDVTQSGLQGLSTREWTNGLFFFNGHPKQKVVFPWPTAFLE
jgi:hypothetical protein